MVSSALIVGFLLAVASGAGWTGLDAIRKRLAGNLSPLAILLGLVLAQIPVHTALLLGSGLPEVAPPFWLWMGAAAAIAIAANVMLTVAVRSSPLGLVVPFLSFTPVATLLTAWLLLGQRPGASGAAGVVLVVFGALSLDASPRELLGDPLRSLREPGTRLALAVALLFALANAIDRQAVLHASEPFYALAVASTMAIVLLGVGRVRRELLAARSSWSTLAAAGVVMAAALLLHLFAYRYLLVAYVDAVKRAAANVFAIGFGRAFFGEAHVTRRLVGALVMSAGVALILLG